ncbi:MAG: exostosin family protein [Pirellulales bacterium]
MLRNQVARTAIVETSECDLGLEPTARTPAAKLRIFFPGFDERQRPVPLAHACGLGKNPHGGYVFTRPGSWEELAGRVQTVFERVQSLGESDLVVYPHLFLESATTRNIEEQAQGRNVPCVFFRNNDHPPSVHLRHGVVFQEAVLASRKTHCEFPHPAVIDDLAVGRDLTFRGYADRPTVSFCGNLGRGSLAEMFWRLRNYWKERHSGAALRRAALKQCQSDPQVTTHFELARFARQPTERDELRERYIQSIADSDYVLCIRGAGNWSYRLYETLCLGRIPVFLNTDSLLPASDVVDWKRQCVWIEPRDFRRVPARIREYHAALTPETYQEIQRSNRSIWKEYLAPFAFWRRAIGDLVRRKQR